MKKIAISIVCICAFMFSTSVANAQGINVFNFGGITASVPCTCTAGATWMVVVGPPKPGVFLYIIGTQGFLNYNLPEPGVYAMGLYIPGVYPCMMGFPPFCFPLPTMGLITPMTGTSLLPL